MNMLSKSIAVTSRYRYRARDQLSEGALRLKILSLQRFRRTPLSLQGKGKSQSNLTQAITLSLSRSQISCNDRQLSKRLVSWNKKTYFDMITKKLGTRNFCQVQLTRFCNALILRELQNHAYPPQTQGVTKMAVIEPNFLEKMTESIFTFQKSNSK